MRREDVWLQVLVERLAQYFFIEANAVEPGPDGGRSALNEGPDLLRELERGRQRRIDQLRWAQPCDRQRPRRRDDVRRDPAAQIYPLEIPEFTILKNSRELQRLVKSGRDAGCLEIVKRE